MKANFKTIVPAAILLAALTGCSTFGGDKTQAQPTSTPAASAPAAATAQQAPATVQVDSIDGKKEVAYKCGDKGQNPLTVMYGFKDNQVVVAQVKYQEKLI